MLRPLTAALLLAAPLYAARPPRAPDLGDPVPATILKARAGKQTCDIGDAHRAPCATVRLGRDRVTVAWDVAERRVTFLYSTTLQTDDDLVLGGLGQIDADSAIQPFLGGFVSPDWCDTDTELSGDALWCAIMKPASRHRGRVVAFVQSIYLLLPDGGPIPLYRTATPPIHQSHFRKAYRARLGVPQVSPLRPGVLRGSNPVPLFDIQSRPMRAE